MINMDKQPDEFLTREEIAQRVKEIAQEINRDYEGRPVLFLGTLTGSFIFLADLVREITLDVQIDFVKLSSYAGTESTREVKEDLKLSWDVIDRHVIIVEDIVDTGHTALYLKKMLAKKRTASVALCSLLDKPSRREVQDITCDYLGFSIPDKFVVGYGLDFNQKYRELPYIGIVS